jgi:hypothetical protein
VNSGPFAIWRHIAQALEFWEQVFRDEIRALESVTMSEPVLGLGTACARSLVRLCVARANEFR